MDELELELQRADEAIAARQKAAKDLEAELTGSSEVQQNPRTRGWFTDVAASALRGPLKMLQSVGRITDITGDVRLNIGNGKPLIEVRSPAEAKAANRGITIKSLVTGQPELDPIDSLIQGGQDALGAPQTKTGNVVQGITQFVSGAVPVGRLGAAAEILQGGSRAITAVRGITFGAVRK